MHDIIRREEVIQKLIDLGDERSRKAMRYESTEKLTRDLVHLKYDVLSASASSASRPGPTMYLPIVDTGKVKRFTIPPHEIARRRAMDRKAAKRRKR